MFDDNISAYSYLTTKSDGAFDLAETIDSSEFQSTAFHGRTRVRKGGSFLSLYDTFTIAEWVKRSNVHPETREDISYMKAHILAKEKWLNLFPSLTPEEVTPEFKAGILREWMMGTLVNLESSRAFLDLATFEEEKYMMRVCVEQAKEMLKVPGDWMIRQSSMHNSMPVNCQVFVLAHCKHDGTVSQMRSIDIIGVGYVILCGSQIPTEINHDVCRGSFVCLTDLLQKYMSVYGLVWDRLLFT
jgi:hypothetical protein